MFLCPLHPSIFFLYTSKRLYLALGWPAIAASVSDGIFASSYPSQHLLHPIHDSNMRTSTTQEAAFVKYSNAESSSPLSWYLTYISQSTTGSPFILCGQFSPPLLVGLSTVRAFVRLSLCSLSRDWFAKSQLQQIKLAATLWVCVRVVCVKRQWQTADWSFSWGLLQGWC